MDPTETSAPTAPESPQPTKTLFREESPALGSVSFDDSDPETSVSNDETSLEISRKDLTQLAKQNTTFLNELKSMSKRIEAQESRLESALQSLQMIQKQSGALKRIENSLETIVTKIENTSSKSRDDVKQETQLSDKVEALGEAMKTMTKRLDSISASKSLASWWLLPVGIVFGVVLGLILASVLFSPSQATSSSRLGVAQVSSQHPFADQIVDITDDQHINTEELLRKQRHSQETNLGKIKVVFEKQTDSNFITFLRMASPRTTVEVVSRDDLGTIHPGDFVLHVHRLVSTKLDGFFDSNLFAVLIEKSGGNAVFTSLRSVDEKFSGPAIKGPGVISGFRQTGESPQKFVLEFRGGMDNAYDNLWNRAMISRLEEAISRSK